MLKIEIAGSEYPNMTLIELIGLRASGKDESLEVDFFHPRYC
jgi:hypothetical protein